MKKVVIIGAGIAGLSAGIYGQKYGLATEIYESRLFAGGECTGWQRGAYQIDGCIHWLMGSRRGLPLNRIWREVGALNDQVRIINHEIFGRYEMDGRVLNFYTNIRKLTAELLSLSPADRAQILEMARMVRKLARLGMPVDRPFDQLGILDGLKIAPKMAKYAAMSAYGKVSLGDYAGRFQDPLIRLFITSLMPAEYNAASFLLTLASLNDGDSGYPAGGSKALADRMADRYLELGGKLNLNREVASVMIEEGTARGIRLADGRQVLADAVIAAADGYETLYRLLDGHYLTPFFTERYQNIDRHPVQITAMVAFGINSDLAGIHHLTTILPANPVDGGNCLNSCLILRHQGFDRSLAPAGKTVLKCMVNSDYAFWDALRGDPAAYRREKERLARDVLAAVEARLPGISALVEMTDVATPLTYERFCHAHRGAWMSWITTARDGGMSYQTGVLPGLANFWLTGQWTMPPGGLPAAVITGKFTIQRMISKKKTRY